jgi:polyribonucleotide 5'-hydroxyl-kinase
MREDALREKRPGPNVFITGGSGSGKTTICKMLVNYSIKLGWTPLLVDIDPIQNIISSPGCLSAALIDQVLEGYTDNLTSKSINYFHGACQPGNFIITPDYFDTQI